jgi:hypothetical protein
MDTYDAQIRFIDRVSGTETDITGLETSQYIFDYVPKAENGEIVAEENRFYIQLSPAAATPLNPVFDDPVMVYGKNKAIHIVSGASNPLQQVFVYTIQGVLVYSATHLNAASHTIHYHPDRLQIGIVKLITAQGMKSVKLINK